MPPAPPDLPPETGPFSITDADGPCAAARVLRAAAQECLEGLRSARREHTEVSRAVERATGEADRHAVAERKTVLVETWRAAMAAATSEEERRDATAAWLRDLSDLNRRTRTASRRLATGHQELRRLEQQVVRADLAAAAARIRAEAAEAACAEARHRRADEDEARTATDRATLNAADEGMVSAEPVAAGPGSGAGPRAGGDIAEGATRSVPGTGDATSAGDAGDADDAAVDERAPVRTVLLRAADSSTIRGLMAGDPATHQAVASELAEMSDQVPARYLLLLDTLVEELTAAALDALALAFDQRHPLWGSLSTSDSRLVMRGLRDLGFRLDLHDGWYGGRAPTPSDLAAALGFAGLDARSVRGMPGSAELRELPGSVLVAAHDHLREEAPDLRLDQVMRLLGPRAARLSELWDEWGRLRPILAEELPARA